MIYRGGGVDNAPCVNYIKILTLRKRDFVQIYLINSDLHL